MRLGAAIVDLGLGALGLSSLRDLGQRSDMRLLELELVGENSAAGAAPEKNRAVVVSAACQRRLEVIDTILGVTVAVAVAVAMAQRARRAPSRGP